MQSFGKLQTDCWITIDHVKTNPLDLGHENFSCRHTLRMLCFRGRAVPTVVQKQIR